MKRQTLRILIPVFCALLAFLGFALHLGFGSVSGFGWSKISLLCPMGALGTMLASKTLLPRALIALLIAVVLIILLGRAFCGWVCPVPLLRKVASLFKKKKKTDDASGVAAADSVAVLSTEFSVDELSDSDKAAIEASIAKNVKATCSSKKGCQSCADVHAAIDSRHFVLAGGLLSAAIFGFPVFCLVCPIGLFFGTIFLLVQLFGSGDITWTILAAPALLALELIVFRKWCSRICPLSALMSLVGRINRKSMRPVVDTNKCIESADATCGKCHEVCEVNIDPRHPQNGASFAECTKCFACVDACPGHAIKMPFVAPSSKLSAKKEKSN